jgi:hypothetical protein
VADARVGGGEGAQRQDVDRHAAAVHTGVLDRGAGEIRDGVRHHRLERMRGLGVPLDLPAARHRPGEHVGVLAGAVVVDGGRRLDGPPRLGVGRQRRRAAQRGLVQAGGGQHLANRGDVLRFAGVRAGRAGQRELAKAEVALDAQAQHGHGLQRLGAGAQVDRKLRVAGGGDHGPLGVCHRHDAEVLALDESGTVDLNDDPHDA